LFGVCAPCAKDGANTPVVEKAEEASDENGELELRN